MSSTRQHTRRTNENTKQMASESGSGCACVEGNNNQRDAISAARARQHARFSRQLNNVQVQQQLPQAVDQQPPHVYARASRQVPARERDKRVQERDPEMATRKPQSSAGRPPETAASAHRGKADGSACLSRGRRRESHRVPTLVVTMESSWTFCPLNHLASIYQPSANHHTGRRSLTRMVSVYQLSSSLSVCART